MFPDGASGPTRQHKISSHRVVNEDRLVWTNWPVIADMKTIIVAKETGMGVSTSPLSPADVMLSAAVHPHYRGVTLIFMASSFLVIRRSEGLRNPVHAAQCVMRI
jgi:hypothetical protein